MTMINNASAPELRFIKSGAAAILQHMTPSYLIQINTAFREFRRFKALSPELLADLGISPEQQESVTFAEFCRMPGR